MSFNQIGSTHQHEVLVLGEVIKLLFAAYMIYQEGTEKAYFKHMKHVTACSHKMVSLYPVIAFLSFNSAIDLLL